MKNEGSFLRNSIQVSSGTKIPEVFIFGYSGKQLEKFLLVAIAEFLFIPEIQKTLLDSYWWVWESTTNLQDSYVEYVFVSIKS